MLSATRGRSAVKSRHVQEAPRRIPIPITVDRPRDMKLDIESLPDVAMGTIDAYERSMAAVFCDMGLVARHEPFHFVLRRTDAGARARSIQPDWVLPELRHSGRPRWLRPDLRVGNRPTVFEHKSGEVKSEYHERLSMLRSMFGVYVVLVKSNGWDSETRGRVAGVPDNAEFAYADEVWKTPSISLDRNGVAAPGSVERWMGEFGGMLAEFIEEGKVSLIKARR